MSRANLGVFEASLLASWLNFLEALSNLLLRASYDANVNFLSLRNLASNELFFASFISL
ncbi:hypothetical protein [Fusobacterium sp. 1001295B_180824_G3]|uniref:hypothetical protein n=1 Tax=Fusobacterium sp. 1001295B_180824_G3 TaxID=2787123 RepID=UPI001E388BB1|nr:hypothetical protein [Fusobacterium sp. 1001295B_180824_G3]